MTSSDLTDPAHSAPPAGGEPGATPALGDLGLANVADDTNQTKISTGTAARRRSSPPPVVAWAALTVGIGLAGAVLFLGYLAMSRTQPTNADGASQALQAWDMLHGNVLLHGWTLSDVSFYPTELVLYLLVEAAYGLNADVVHVVAALTFALLVLVTAALARGSARGREAATRIGLVLTVILVPAAGTGSWVLLLSPDHTGTGVPLMLTWLVLDRGLRSRSVPRWLPYAVTALLAWGQVADPLVFFVGVLPLVTVGGWRVWRDGRRGVGDGAHRRRRGTDARLVAAGLASVGLAFGIRLAISLAGGFTTHAPPVGLRWPSRLPENLRITARTLGLVFGAYLPERAGPAGTAVGLVHLAALLAALGAVVVVLTRLGRGATDRVDEVMAVGILVNLAAFAVSTLPGDLTTARQLAVTLPLGAALLARGGGRWLASARPAAGRVWPAAAAALLVVCGEFAVRTAERPAPPAGQEVAQWLEAHGLHYGLGGFWTANNITLITGGRVRAVPVTGGSGIRAYRWESKVDWYDPALFDARFVVIDRLDATHGTLAGAQAQFGPARQRQDFDRLTVLVYDHNLLVGLPAYCYPGTAPSMAECPTRIIR